MDLTNEQQFFTYATSSNIDNAIASSTTNDSSYDFLSSSNLGQGTTRKDNKLAGVRILY